MEPLDVRLRASLRCVVDLVCGVEAAAAADDLDDVLVSAAEDDLDDVLAAAAAADDLDDVLESRCCGFLLSFSAGFLFSGSVRMLACSSVIMRSKISRSMCLS